MDKKKLIIYLADNDEDDRFFIRQAIEHLNTDTTIIEAENGQDLLELLTDEKSTDYHIQLILLDMNMPLMTGLEALEAIRAIPRLGHIPIIILSTDNHINLVQEAYRKGANSYIKKPISIRDLSKIADAIKICFLE